MSGIISLGSWYVLKSSMFLPVLISELLKQEKCLMFRLIRPGITICLECTFDYEGPVKNLTKLLIVEKYCSKFTKPMTEKYNNTKNQDRYIK